MTTFKLSNITTRTISPATSNLCVLVTSDFVSGVPLMSNIESTATIIEKMKIHLQPIVVATAPPKSEQIPLPPQEPIDQ
ncbi:Uncharacterised protein [Staphylococcus aureus]|nr:Uncharacterised protein [Staphylococcus aureus]